MPLMRVMLLHWEMMNEHSASHLSCRRMRIPRPNSTHCARYSPQSKPARSRGIVTVEVKIFAPQLIGRGGHRYTLPFCVHTRAGYPKATPV